jgi:hypothetical protein
MLFYLLGFLILCVMFFFVYIRFKYKFWSLQPVFHFYDIYYWFINVGIIRHELPTKNRYVNLKNIITKHFEEIDKLTKKQMTTLIQLNYFRNKENKFYPQQENIDPYFIGHNSKTFWSYYVEEELFINNKTGKTITNNNIIGIMTSRPLHVKINTYSNRKDTSFDVYYVDYLCVNKNWRKKNIAPQLIQTHEYIQSYGNRKISVSLFKREEELTGIIPLTIYKTYCFNMCNWTIPKLLNAHISLLSCDKQNIYYVYNFISEITKQIKQTTQTTQTTQIKSKFDILVYPEISNLIELVVTGNVFIKMLVIDGEIEAVYIFRKTCTFIEKDKEIISCIGSINGNKLTNDEFIQGFKISLWSIIKEHNNFQYLTIEDISDNTPIINNICIKTYPIAVSPMAYFFYNFAYSPFKSNKCFIIN